MANASRAASWALADLIGMLQPIRALCYYLSICNDASRTRKVFIMTSYQSLDQSPQSVLQGKDLCEYFDKLLLSCETLVSKTLDELNISLAMPSKSEGPLFEREFPTKSTSTSSHSPHHYVRVIDLAPIPDKVFSPLEIDAFYGTGLIVEVQTSVVVLYDGINIKLPDFSQLRVRSPDLGSSVPFKAGSDSLEQLQLIARCLICLAVQRHKLFQFPWNFNDVSSKDDDVVGILVLQDQILMANEHGRPRKKEALLFENYLAFSRPKNGMQMIISHRIPISNLLCVTFRPQDSEGGILTVYWKVKRRKFWAVSSAEMFFDDLGTLKLWAGFLAFAIDLQPALQDEENSSNLEMPSNSIFQARSMYLKNFPAILPDLPGESAGLGFGDPLSPISSSSYYLVHITNLRSIMRTLRAQHPIPRDFESLMRLLMLLGERQYFKAKPIRFANVEETSQENSQPPPGHNSDSRKNLQ